MGNNKHEGSLGRRVADLDHRVADLAMRQRRVDHLLRVKNNWHSETAAWLGEIVAVQLKNGEELLGRLKWNDQYQIAIVPKGRKNDDPQIINKGSMAYIELAERQHD